MIETPSSVIMIDQIVQHSDFISIGTNDLIQYLMAADRENQSLAHYYEAGNRMVIEFLKQVLQSAKECGLECTLCGELAGDLRFTEDLLDIGLRRFSVSPRLVHGLKEKLISIAKRR
ncbi:MAG: hypothetical protein AMS17_04305 [Spirochaetes bacterium DG_61]|jgi:phosphotransferase system enzyme I (PtsI)|nr:MAG: hypothetical protein AMS17_04305 [Spirochaetes bacterium DG_61]